MHRFWGVIKTAFQDFLEDECLSSGAALAYYTVFSLPPLLVLVFLVASWFGVSEQRIQEVVSRQAGVPVPDQSSSQAGGGQSESSEESKRDGGGGLTEVARRTSSSAQPLKSLGPLSKVIGAVVLVFSATGVFAQLQWALNKAWEVEPDPEQSGWKGFLAKRGLSLGMIIVIAFLLLVSLVVTTLVDEIVHMVVGESAGAVGTAIGMLLNNLVVLGLVTILFAAMYKILPDAQIRWKDLWMGAFLTALLFVIGKTLTGWYLQNSEIGAQWGSAAASLVALLVWVYYTSLIVLFGAELTQAWAKAYGPGIVPAQGAVRVVEEKRHVR